MARHFGWTLTAFLIVGSVGILGQSEPPQSNPPKQTQQKPADGHERRGWWQSQRIVAELGLTPDQITQLDRIFQKHSEKAIPLRTEVDELEKAIDQAIRTQKLDANTFAQEVDRIENKRAELNKMRAVMLYRLRLVLNADQNDKFQAMRDRQEAQRRKQEGDRRR